MRCHGIPRVHVGSGQDHRGLKPGTRRQREKRGERLTEGFTCARAFKTKRSELAAAFQRTNTRARDSDNDKKQRKNKNEDTQTQREIPTNINV